MIAGSLVGVVTTLPSKSARRMGSLYIAVFRNVPLLLQLFLWFFVLPEILPAGLGRFLKRDLPFPEFWTSIIGLGLFTSSRVAVQVAAGIRAVPPGQRLAALAIGMSSAKTYRFVLLPQAVRIMLPPLTSELLTIFKNSSIALTIGVFELTARTQQIESTTYQSFEAFTAATLIYFAIAMIATGLMRSLEIKLALPGIGHTQ
jgi:glutamate/aspartate transport system permease protein